MMNAVMKRPMFQPRIVRRQEGTPQGGERSVDPYFGSGSTGLSSLQKFFTQFMDAPEKVRLDEIRDNAYSYYYNELLKGTDYPGPDQLKSARDQANILADQTVQTFISNFNPDIPSQGSIDFLKNKVPSEFYLNAIKNAAKDPRPGYGDRPNIKTVSDVIDPDSSLRFLFPFTDFPKGRKQLGREVDELMKISEYNRNLPVAKAEGGPVEDDAVGIASGLDEETTPGDPSKDGIAKVSPEQYVQLMNDVRGDEVPLEGRVQELAMTVGEKDAQDTPLSVLALVQPVFELQEQQGIGATQQAQNMVPPMASDQLANPQNMGVVRARTGLYIDQTEKGPGISSLDRGIYEGQIVGPMPTGSFGMYGTPTIEGAFSTGLIAGQGQPNQTNVDQADISSMLISDLMSKYAPPQITADSLQKEIDLLKSIQGDTKGEAQKALAFLGIQKGLELAEGEKSIEQLLSETAGDIFKITNAVTQADKAVALQAYKSLADRRSSMTAKQFELEKMQLENDLRVAFEQAKGMEDPIFLKEPRSGKVTVLDKKKDADKISVLLGSKFEIVPTTKGQEINISLPENVSGMKDGGIVYRSNGSNSSGETSIQPFSYEEALKGIQEGTMGYSEEDLKLPGGLVLITDKALRSKYNNRIFQGVKLEGYLDQAIKLIEENPKLAGLVGDAIQGTQNVVLPINQLLAVVGQESPFPEKVNEFVSDPDIQELAALEYRIADNLATFEKDVASTRVPAIDKVREYMKRLKVSGLSSDVQAINALKSFRNDLVDTLNQMRIVTGNDPILGSSDLDAVITKYSLSPDDDLIKLATDAVRAKPAYKDKIIQSLIDKLEARSED